MRHQKRYAVVEKYMGETPRMALERFRAAECLPESLPLTYAGRLDPLASGKLLILIGDECKKKDAYTSLDKEYVVEILLGFSTDTGDVLGIPTRGVPLPQPGTPSAVRNVLHTFIGKCRVPYPHFSSKTVAGKSLLAHTLEGNVHTITIPTTVRTIYRISLDGIRTISTQTLHDNIHERLSTIAHKSSSTAVMGNDFRLPTITTAWEHLRAFTPHDALYTILTVRVTCSSGTYMRTLANDIARALGTSGLAFSIRRTHIGRYLSFPFFPHVGIWRDKA